MSNRCSVLLVLLFNRYLGLDLVFILGPILLSLLMFPAVTVTSFNIFHLMQMMYSRSFIVLLR